MNTLMGYSSIVSASDQIFYFSEIATKSYLIVFLQMSVIIVMLFPKASKRKAFDIKCFNILFNTHLLKMILVVFSFIVLSITLYFLIRVNVTLFSSTRSILMNQFPYFQLIAFMSYIVLFYSLEYKHKKLFLISFLPLLISFFIGTRSYFVIAVAMVLVYQNSIKEFSFKKNIVFIIIGSLFFFGFMVYKEIYNDFRNLDFQSVIETLSNGHVYISSITELEAYAIFSNFNYIVENNFRYNVAEVFIRISSFIPLINNFFDSGTSYRLSEILRVEVYGIHFGVGSSFWGDSYAMGGILLVVIFTYIWFKFIIFSNKLMHQKNKIKYFVVPYAFYISFYISRLDFTQLTGAFKVFFMLLLIAIALIMIFNLLPKTTKKINLGDK